MKELESKLNQNLQMIEERNSEYEKALNQEQENWEATLKNIEDGESQIAEVVKNLPVVGVGDSVFLGAIDGLYKTFPNGYFDGKVSRAIPGGESVLIDLKNKGMLGNTIILALANNGDYAEWRLNKLMETIGDRQVYWVEATNGVDPKFNENFKEYAKQHPNIHVVEWSEKSKDHPEYFYADKLHVKGDGINAYANAIYETIYNVYLEEYRNQHKDVIEKHEEEMKNKIAFYGNDVLTSAFSYINEKFPKAIFNAKADYTFDTLYNELKSKVEAGTLEHRIVLLFDKEIKVSQSDYDKIVDLAKDKEIYICNLSKNKYSFANSNVKVIDFYDEIQKNEGYLMSDKVHLSDMGNKALVDMISKVISTSVGSGT